FIRRDLGFDGIRVFPNWWVYDAAQSPCPRPGDDTLFAADGRVRGDLADGRLAGRLEALVRLIRAAGAQGLVVDLAVTRERGPGGGGRGLVVDRACTREAVPGDMRVAAYQRALQRTAFLLRAYRHVLSDVQNERDEHDTPFMFLSDAEVRAIRDAVRDPAHG